MVAFELNIIWVMMHLTIKHYICGKKVSMALLVKLSIT